MSGFSYKSARKRAGSKLGAISRQAARRQHSGEFGSDAGFGFGPMQMMSQFDYGISPLSEEEVRRLPVAHQYSS
ncbi:MAG: hypothetical protein ACT4OU_08390 [Hyphomicrobium sp.]